jgi:hypothetical protein
LTKAARQDKTKNVGSIFLSISSQKFAHIGSVCSDLDTKGLDHIARVNILAAARAGLAQPYRQPSGEILSGKDE